MGETSSDSEITAQMPQTKGIVRVEKDARRGACAPLYRLLATSVSEGLGNRVDTALPLFFQPTLPGYLLRQSITQCIGRDEVQRPGNTRAVRSRMVDVASLDRFVPQTRCASNQFSQERQQHVDRNRRAATNIKNAPSDRVDAFGSTQISGHNVSNIGEIATLSTIPIHGDQLVAQQGRNKAVDRHVGALPWPVDREIAQYHRRNTEVLVVQRTEVLARQLRHPIW